MTNRNQNESPIKAVVAIALAGALFIGTGVGGCVGFKHVQLYSATMNGKSVLAEAESSRQVKTLEARATMESAKLLADAEITRAKGAAEANHILQGSLGGPEGYLRYLQIQALSESKGEKLIYVPTEAGLPVTEASRLNNSKPAAE